MYQTIEAEIGPDGVVTLHEAIHPPGRFLAMVTILTPLEDAPQQKAAQRAWIDRIWSHRTRIAEPVTPLSREDVHSRP